MAEKRAFVSAVLMSTRASDIFTQDIEDFPELVAGQVAPPMPVQKVVEIQPAQQTSSSELSPAAKKASKPMPGSNSGQGLSPKRSAWLLRVGQEAKVSQEAMSRCMAYLQIAGASEVRMFFDELASRRVRRSRRSGRRPDSRRAAA